jgi:hypothetical protein
MANINSSLDEILTELGDGYDADISASQRKIVRSTANKIWLMLRAFSRGLFGLYQVVAALKYRFDPIYCTDEELESTMRITGTALKPGKASLLTVTIWNNSLTEDKDLLAGTYTYLSSNGITFSLLLQDDLTIPMDSFVKRDFFSSLSGEPYIGAFAVSDFTDITVTELDEAVIDEDISFDCEDNANQLGYPAETLFELRQRILTDNKRQEILSLLEERLQTLPNIHECTILSNNTLAPINSPYLQDDGLTYLQILPQSVLVILTGSPTADFVKEFLSLCPFVTTVPVGVAEYGTVYYDTSIYIDGRFPVHYVYHRVETYNVTIKYAYVTTQVSTITIESVISQFLQVFKANTRYKELISTDDFVKTLAAYQNPSVKILSVSFTYGGSTVDYMQFNKTQIAQLGTISFVKVPL